MDVEKRKYFEEPCMKKIYTLKDNINVEEICMKKLEINQKIINNNECYYKKKSEKKNQKIQILFCGLQFGIIFCF